LHEYDVGNASCRFSTFDVPAWNSTGCP
jgi:hypothetical protein